MTKSESAWEDEEFESVWHYIKDNPLLLGLPLSENKGIDLLSALKDVYEMTKVDVRSAQTLLTMLANVLVAASQGEGEEVVEEVIVQEAIADMDSELKEILNEG